MLTPTRRTARLAPLTLASLLVLAQLGVLLALAPTAMAAPPTISTITDNVGAGDRSFTNGGETLTITGTNFATVAGNGALPRVLVDGILAPSIVSTSGTSITAKTPAHAAGAVVVQVINPDGEFAGIGYQYIASAAPTITSSDVVSGPTNGGTQVILTGTNFAADATVRPTVTIGGVRAEVTAVASDGTSLTLVTPPNVAGNNMPLVVRNPDGQTVTTAFSYVPSAAPTIGTLTATGGGSNGGLSVTVAGTNFYSTSLSNLALPKPTLTIGGVNAKITGLTPVSITFETPPHAAGTVDLVVTNPDGQAATRTGAFTYTSDNAPTIATVKVKDAAVTRTTLNTFGGTQITITGTNFHTASNAEPTVTIGGTPVLREFVTVVSATEITAVAPGHAAGAASVSVQNPDGKIATKADGFTYVVPVQVTAVSPTSGTTNGGTTVTVTGTGFQTGARVKFGTGAALDATGSGTTLTVVAPSTGANSVATVPMTVINPDGTQAMFLPGFSYTAVDAADKPKVTSLSASGTSGPTNGGTTVVVTGEKFHTGTNAKPTVAIGATTVPAEQVTVNSATQITIVTAARPNANAATGEDLIVTNPNGQASDDVAGDDFAYVAAGAPDVTGVAVTGLTSNGGVVVTLTGTGFHTGTNAKPAVTVGGTGPTVPASAVTVVSATELRFIAPPRAAGSRDIVVTNPNGLASAPDAVTYTEAAPPTITARSPTSGPSIGGTTLTLTGTNFFASSDGSIKPTVTFGTSPGVAGVVGTVTATSVTVTVPGHPVQSGVTVTLTNPDGDPATTTYTYTPSSAPAITSLSPATAAAAQLGNVMTITGTGFGTNAKVFVDGVEVGAPNLCTGANLPVKGCAARSATSIAIVVPGHAPNQAVDVRVQNEDNLLSGAASLRYLVAPPVLTSSSGTSTAGTGGTVGADTVAFGGTNIALQTEPFQQAAVSGILAAAAGATSAITPSVATPGAVSTQVVDVDGQSATHGSGFTYVQDPGPVVTKVVPNAGPSRGGTLVTISGFYFGTFRPLVTVGGLTATLCEDTNKPFTGCAAPTSTEIRVVTPARSAGLADVVVRNLDTQASTSTGAFQFLGAGGAAGPTITSVTPAEGSTAGGTQVTIAGTNFVAGATVKFGTTAATDVVFVSATQITAKTPAGALGKVNMTVTNPDTQSAVKTDAFEYKTATSSTTSTTSSSSSSSSTSTSNTGSSTTTGTGSTTTTNTNDGVVTAAEILEANDDIDVDVTRDGDDNLVAFDLPTQLPATIAGVQLWRSNSPFVLIATLDDSDADFQDGEYRDADAPAGSKYIVTAYYGLTNALGFSSCAVNADCTGSALPPGFAALGDGSGTGSDDGVATWVWVVLGVLVLVVIVVIVIFVSRSRRPAARTEPAGGYAWDTPSASEPAAAPVADQVHNTRCPTCKSEFSVTGKRPLATTCPSCGQRGMLR